MAGATAEQQSAQRRPSPFRKLFSKKKHIHGTSPANNASANGNLSSAQKQNGKILNGNAHVHIGDPAATAAVTVSTFPRKEDSSGSKLLNGNGLNLTNGQNSTTGSGLKKQKKKQTLVGQEKAKSIEALHAGDSVYLTEALETFGDSQPMVARSVPKHAPKLLYDKQALEAKTMQHCIFPKDVYDHIVENSLNACSLLQHQLDDMVEKMRSDSKSTADDSGNMINGIAATAKLNSTAATEAGIVSDSGER